MKGGRRTDGGPGACVPADLLDAFGGENARISYRGLGLLEALFRDPSLRLDAVVAITTLGSSRLTGWVSFVKHSADDKVANIAAIVVIAAFLATLARFWKEYKAL